MSTPNPQHNEPAPQSTKPMEPDAKQQEEVAPPKAEAISAAELLFHKKGAPSEHGHVFWDTQPVPKMEEEVQEEGPLENRTLDDVPKQPYAIASTFEWWVPDLHCAADVEAVYTLLSENYVEDDDSMFRFNYSADFLQWALTPPGYFPDWHVAVRKKSDQKLLAFISGIPMHVRVGPSERVMCEINFLCVHKKLREKRMAPILIKEVTRRVNLQNIWQAVYTAGITLPRPITSAQYWHRSLNPQKLVSIRFSRVPPQYEKFVNPLEIMKRVYQLPQKTASRGLREMVPDDVPAVCRLLRRYLAKFRVAPAFTEADVAHWLLPRRNVVFAYVVEADGAVTDFVSFYNLPSTVIGNAKYSELRAAYSYYVVSTTVDLKVLMNDALILAKQQDFDVFNTLDIMDNGRFIHELKFGQGDGCLQYYFYNWKFPTISPNEVGLVML